MNKIPWLCVLALTGCVGSKVGWIDCDAGDGDNAGGVYNINVVGHEDANIDVLGMKTGKDENALPVDIEVKMGDAKDAVGALASINNVLSICTIGLWPYISAKELPYTVTVRTPGKSTNLKGCLGERAWNSFLLPLAALPCPGFGDWRSSGMFVNPQIDGVQYDSIVSGAVGNVLTQEFYDREIKKWSENKRKLLGNVKQHLVDEDADSKIEKPIVLIDDKDVVNKTGHELAISDVSDRLENRLDGLKSFRIVTPRAVDRGVVENQLYDMLTGGALDAVKGISVPSFRIEAVIHEFGFSSETKPYVEQNDIAKTFRSGKRTTVRAKVELTLKMTDMKTGETVFSDNLSSEIVDTQEDGVSVQKGHGFDNGSDKHLYSKEQYMDKAMNQALEKFYSSLSRKRRNRIIDCASNGSLTINVPRDFVAKGENLGLYRVMRNSSIGDEVARVRVSTVKATSCTADLVDIKDENYNGEVVVMKVE